MLSVNMFIIYYSSVGSFVCLDLYGQSILGHRSCGNRPCGACRTLPHHRDDPFLVGKSHSRRIEWLLSAYTVKPTRLLGDDDGCGVPACTYDLHASHRVCFDAA